MRTTSGAGGKSPDPRPVNKAKYDKGISKALPTAYKPHWQIELEKETKKRGKHA